MTLTDKEKLSIEAMFANAKDKYDLLNLINFAKAILNGKRNYPFSLKQLTYYIQPVNANTHYHSFEIAKKRGGKRMIEAPARGLKELQRALNVILQAIYRPPKSAFGFVNGRSIRENAAVHVNSSYLYNIDIYNFFNSIEQKRVWACLQNPPFKISKENIAIANMISAICCKAIQDPKSGERKNVLPQGAPTSPVISNIVCQKLDFLLLRLSKKFGLRYTRYVDDITFSSSHNLFYQGSPFLNELNIIFTGQGFCIQQDKTRLKKRGQRQEVTGLVTNTRVNVKRTYVKKIRSWLYLLEKYAAIKAFDKMARDYAKDKRRQDQRVDFYRVLQGRINYVGLIRGKTDPVYRQLFNRFRHIKKRNIRRAEYDAGVLSKILFQFSTNKNDLKYATHSWEYGKFDGYEDFMKKIKVEWFKLEKKLRTVAPYVHAKISNFLFNEHLGQTYTDGSGKTKVHQWGNFNLTIGWSSFEVKRYSVEKNAAPFYMPLPETVIAGDRSLNYFYEIVDVFKSEIEYREENDQLYNVFARLWSDVLSYDFEVDMEETKGISFYTDVVQINRTLRLIFEQIKARGEQHRKVIIHVVKNFDKNYTELHICHLGSVSKRKIDDPIYKAADKGDFSTIKNQLLNLCDWSIIAQFPDQRFNRIDFLKTGHPVNDHHIEFDVTAVDGFTHILKFYEEKSSVN